MHERMTLPGLVAADYRLFNRGRKGRLRRLSAALGNRGFSALLLFRLSHALQGRVPALPYLLSRLTQLLYAVDIDPRAELGPGIVLVHCFGIVVGSSTQIEGDCVIFHGVTFGDRGSEWVGSNQQDGHPVVGRNCMFGAGAKVLGGVRIGNNCVVGANAVVLNDVPENSVVAGLPAKIVSQRPLMDEDLRPIYGHRSDAPKVPLKIGSDT